MATRRVNLEELNRLAKSATSHTYTINSSLGYYEAVVEVEGKLLKLSCEALNPEADGYVEEIDAEMARKLGVI